MENTEEPWELFDLEADLQVTLSEDGKDYLRQFGLEQYDFEHYQPDDDPGTFFRDVPLEQNPEAMFDLLMRESFRDTSNRRTVAPPSSAHAPSRQNSSSQQQRSSTRSASTTRANSNTSHNKAASPNNHSNNRSNASSYHGLDLDDGLPASPKSPSKRVSFTEGSSGGGNLVASSGSNARFTENKENNPSDATMASAAASDGPSFHFPFRHSKAVTNFFGRPKVKQKNKADASSKSSPEHSANGVGQSDNRPGVVHGMQGQAKNENHDAGRKNKKFKFPVLDLMGRSKKNVTTSATPNSDTNRQAFGGKQGPISQSAQAGNHQHQASNGSHHQQQQQSQSAYSLDLLQGSPELGNSSSTRLKPADVPPLSLTDSDSDTYATPRPVDPLPSSSSSSHDDFMIDKEVLSLESIGALPQIGSKAKASDVKVVEVVSCHRQPEEQLRASVAGEIAEQQNEFTKDSHTKDSQGVEHLPPGLLAAVIGDIKLLKESVSHLTYESLNKLRDTAGNTILHACASGGHLDCTEFVCCHYPQLLISENKAHLSPTAMAIKHGQIEVLDWLLDNMDLQEELCQTKTPKRTLLHHAAKFGQDGCLRLLLSKMDSGGMLSDTTDQSGNTPAHIAAKYGHLMCLQSLVDFGMDVCLVNQHGHTPCYYADFNNHRHCAGYLMVVETCATLAQKHVTQTVHSDWLQNKNDAIAAFTTEALTISGAIARKSSDDVDITCRLQQTLDDAMDLVGDMASQLNHLYELTCHLQEEMGTISKENGQPQSSLRLESPGKDDLQVSMERATELQRRLEELDQAVNHHASRQHLLKVKDVQRRWESVINEDSPKVGDVNKASKQLTRKLFSEAVQRLLVYRTDDSLSRQASTVKGADPHQQMAPLSHDLDKPTPAWQPGPNQRTPSVPTHTLLNIPVYSNVDQVNQGNCIRSKLAAGDPLKMSGTLQQSKPLLSGTKSNREQPLGGTSQSKGAKDLLETLKVSSIGDRKSVSSSDESDSSRSHTSSGGVAKNNVAESFLKSRMFYQQDPNLPGLGLTRGAPQPPSQPPPPGGGLFYSSQQGRVISQLQKPSDSLGLQFSSEFSAFNRVSNKPIKDDGGKREKEADSPRSRSDSSAALQVSVKETAALDISGNSDNSNRSNVSSTSKDSPRRKVTDEDKSVVPETSPRISQREPMKIGNVQRLVPHLQERNFTGKGEHEERKERKVIAPGVYIDSGDSEEAISEPTIPPPPQPPLQKTTNMSSKSKPAIPKKPSFPPPPPPPLLSHDHQPPSSSKQPKPVSSHSATSSSETNGDSSCTFDDDDDDDDDQSEDLSGIDLGAELNGDDLMLDDGPRTFLDDEVDELDEGEEQYVDDIFSPEDLLALAPRGALPLSMQFETSLSTIEEVSVVSESTRADDPATDVDCNTNGDESDSDDTVTQPSDHEGDRDPMARRISASSPIIPVITTGDGEKPWYETSDDEDSSIAASQQPSLSAATDRPDHFTLF